jgi:hypothetical protein
MMPSPNDIDLVRVFTRAVGGATAETALPFNANFEVVVDAEAGGTILATGAQFAITLVVRDLTSGANFTATPKAGTNTPAVGTNANLSSAAWPAQSRQFAYTVNAPGPARENDFCEVLASVRVGVNNPDVEFATSPLFIMIRP